MTISWGRVRAIEYVLLPLSEMTGMERGAAIVCGVL